MSATGHEAPYVLDGLLHHGTGLRIDTHYVDTGGASDQVPSRGVLEMALSASGATTVLI